jgi:drug/metabolite transporter (DMT)-like permease
MTAPQSRAGGEAVMLGIGLSLLAYALFSLHDASIKWLVAALPAWQILFCRSAAIVAGCLVIGRGRLLGQALATPLKAPLAVRGAITLAAWLCYYTAARSTPLAQLVTLYFSAPILVTAMSAPLLGERVSRIRWATVGIGFAGVLVAADPMDLRPSVNTLLVLIAAAFWAYAIILMRRIARRESSLLQMFYSNGFFLIATGIACLFGWRTPDAGQVALLAIVGVVGGLAQFLLYEGARHAPASLVATLEYSALLWAFVLGYAIWGDIPPPAVFAGAFLILAAGLLLVGSERRVLSRARQPEALPAPELNPTVPPLQLSSGRRTGRS